MWRWPGSGVSILTRFLRVILRELADMGSRVFHLSGALGIDF
ncbi:unnamed protein product [Acidithrix sp. C25]|nr:unnamed protein product [Acidithrix sp. C25]